MKCKLTLQEKLKNLRVEHRLSFEQLADATKISRSVLGASIILKCLMMKKW